MTKQLTLDGNILSQPTLPKEYQGTYRKKNEYIKTTPRTWTTEEIKFMNELINQGYTTQEISQALNRSNTSVAIKRKRLSKKEPNKKQYNNEHSQEKQENNNNFLTYMQPRNVLDVYNGGNKQYQKYHSVTNDLDDTIECDYHMDAYKFMLQQHLQQKKYDFIDLDPFGSAYNCFDIAFKLIRTNNPNQRGGGNLHYFW